MEGEGAGEEECKLTSSGDELQVVERVEDEPEAEVEGVASTTDAAPFDMPSYGSEIDQITRAMFVHAGSATDNCVFDDVLDAENHSRLLQPVELSQEDISDTASGGYEGEDKSRYFPLEGPNRFRILTIEPGHREDALHTVLSPADLDDEHPDFEAISYCWGAPSDKTSLLCDSQYVTVPTSLVDALRQIRSPTKRKRVWADAACINQEDVEERNRQVAVMRHIFRRASRVLVWLGRDQDDIATVAFQLTCDIVKQWKPEGNLYAWETYRDITEPVGELPSSLKSVDLEAWDHLRTMFELAWFRRVWVVQEVNVASSVVVLWGTHHIAWSLIGLCAAWIVTQGWYAMEDLSIAQAYNAFFQYAILPLSGQDTFTAFRELELCVVLGIMRGAFDATDARDRVFGILGLRLAGNDTQSEKLLMQPDYAMSLKEVYVEAAKTILIHDRHLRMLTAVQHGSEIDEQWPSWVPRWDQSHAVSIGFGDERGLYANAGELFNVEDATDALFEPDGLSLRVVGLRCHTITEVSDELSWANFAKDHLGESSEIIDGMISELINPDNLYRFRPSDDSERRMLPGYTAKNTLENNPLWYKETRMSNASRSPGKYYQRLFLENHASDTLWSFALYWRERSGWRESENLDRLRRYFRNEGKSGSDAETLISSYSIFFNRRLIRCEDGSVGLGPAACRPGDSVVVLFGGTVPFVLRPRSGASKSSSNDEGSPSIAPSSWTFVGDCFKSDLMKGSAVRERGLLADNHDVDENGLVSFDMPPLVWKDEMVWDSRLDRKAGENGVEEFILR